MGEVQEERKKKWEHGAVHDRRLFLEENVNHVDAGGEDERVACVVAEERGYLLPDVGVVGSDIESARTGRDPASDTGDRLGGDGGMGVL